MMKSYLVLITMDDGSCGRMRGIFCTDWEAIDAALCLDGVVSAVPRREAA
ncbi:hypothetical protein AVHY2522_23630 [Acidovorax sp. SUPP2522]|nr:MULTISPECIES: hypothetical protein [unclassified Acidovorax]WCM99947.1 hypothetical protein M5C96_11415 [Acidovorax sp. GBBC 1281]GKT19752.1 hypothetical protein AVHY2522_23630 [Acidovorax sp. SUPP2522]